MVALDLAVRLSIALGQLRGALWRGILEIPHALHALARSKSHPALHCFVAPTENRSLRMLLNLPGLIEDRLVATSRWEANVVDTICFFMKPQGVFIDIGANIGYHALYVGQSFPEARVLAFEANPSVRSELERNVRLNDAQNVTVFAEAAAEQLGTVAFFAQDETAYNRGRSSTLPNRDLKDSFRRIEVKSAPLDLLLAKLDRADVVKIDTQGSELAVLRGMRGLIARLRPVVTFEFEAEYFQDPVEALRALIDLLPGYDLFQLDPGAAQVLQPFVSPAWIWSLYRVDLVAVPRRASTAVADGCQHVSAIAITSR